MNQDKADLRVLVLSTHPIEPGVGGEMLLHHRMKSCPSSWTFRRHHVGDGFLRHRAGFQRLLRGSRRCQRLLHAFDAWVGLSLESSGIYRACADFQPDVVYAVADGPVMHHALSLAKRWNKPAVLQLDDWQPGGLDVPDALRGALEARFRGLIARSTATFCIGPEMREATRSPRNTIILPPIACSPPIAENPEPGPHLLFAGRFDHFLGPEMKELLRFAASSGRHALLRLAGPDRHWDPETRDLVGRSCTYAGFLKGPELSRELASAGALLVMAPFGPERAHISRFSFPCKIPEYCAQGRPIVVWGPADASSIRWAHATGAACTVTSMDPSAVFAAAARIARDHAFAEELRAAARAESAGRFNATTLQRLFESTLIRAARGERES